MYTLIYTGSERRDGHTAAAAHRAPRLPEYAAEEAYIYIYIMFRERARYGYIYIYMYICDTHIRHDVSLWYKKIETNTNIDDNMLFV